MENVRWQVPVLRQCVVRFEHSERTDQHARGALGADLHLLRPVLKALLEAQTRAIGTTRRAAPPLGWPGKSAGELE